MKPEEVIEKLLALAKGGTEHEAQRAAEKASEIALKYGIDLLQFQSRHDDYTDNSLSDSTRTSQWVSNIVAGVCKVNAVKYYRAYDLPTDTWRYRLIGKPHQIKVVQSIAAYLIEEIKRLNRQAVTLYSLQQSERAQYRKAFRLAASQRIYKRFLEQYDSLHTSPPPSLGHNALVVADYFERTKKEIDLYMQNIGLELTFSREGKGITIKSRDGYADGDKAGKQVSISTQVEGGNYGVLRIGQSRP